MVRIVCNVYIICKICSEAEIQLNTGVSRLLTIMFIGRFNLLDTELYACQRVWNCFFKYVHKKTFYELLYRCQFGDNGSVKFCSNKIL